MGEYTLAIIMAALGLAIGFGVGFLIRRYTVHDKLGKLEQQAQQHLEKAEKTASELVLTAKDEALEIRETAERNWSAVVPPCDGRRSVCSAGAKKWTSARKGWSSVRSRSTNARALWTRYVIS